MHKVIGDGVCWSYIQGCQVFVQYSAGYNMCNEENITRRQNTLLYNKSKQITNIQAWLFLQYLSCSTSFCLLP
jgi:hypothetical protein